jgi:hypothetical protein
MVERFDKPSWRAWPITVQARGDGHPVERISSIRGHFPLLPLAHYYFVALAGALHRCQRIAAAGLIGVGGYAAAFGRLSFGATVVSIVEDVACNR